MSKELDALQRLVNHLEPEVYFGGDYRNYNKDIMVIQKSLEEKEQQDEILRIIKEKEVNVYMLQWYFKHSSYEEYVNDFERNRRDCDLPDLGDKLLAQEEFDLLKEVLK